MGRRKSLGGRALAALIEENDDVTERETRRKSILMDQEKENAGPLQESSLKRKKAAVNYDFGSVINMVTANKVNTKNAWGIDLINNIDQVLDLEKGSFQKASCTLQASVAIYTKRVDSTHEDMFKMLENVNRTRIGKANDAEESRQIRRRANKGTSNNDSSYLETKLSNITHQKMEKEYDVDPLFRKMSKTFDAGGAKGLLLNHLYVHDGPCVIFDTSEIHAFSSLLKQTEEEKEQEQENPANEQDNDDDEKESVNEHQEEEESNQEYKTTTPASETNRIVDWLKMDISSTNPNPVCPSLQVLHRTMENDGEVEQDGQDDVEKDEEGQNDDDEFEHDTHIQESNHTSNSPASDLQQEDEEEDDWGFTMFGGDFDDEDGFVSDQDHDAFDQIASGDAENQDADASVGASHGDGGSVLDQETNNEKANTGRSMVQGGLEIDFAASNFDSYGFGARNTNWAGPNHWKFATKGRTRPRVAGSSSGSNELRKKKEKLVIDFFSSSSDDDDDADEDEPIKMAKTKAAINLTKKSSTSSAKFDLPEDVHYRVRDLCKLFLRPVVISDALRQSRGVPSSGTRLSESNNSTIRQEHDDDDDDDAGFFDFYSPEDDEDGANQDSGNPARKSFAPEGAKNWVAPNRVVEKVSVNYSRTAKKVDVKKLKTTLWETLEDKIEQQDERKLEPEEGGDVQSGDKEEAQERSDESSLSFVEALESAQPMVNDENVTVPIYFICLLHLANENNLELTGSSSMDDFTIKSGSLTEGIESHDQNNPSSRFSRAAKLDKVSYEEDDDDDDDEEDF